MKTIMKALSVALLSGVCFQAQAEDVLKVKTIGYELARDIADAALMACRNQGYQVSVAVVDRGGNVRVIARDDLAPRFSMQIAEEKANAAIMSGTDSGEFVKNRKDIKQELNHVDGIIMMQGGQLIQASGYNIGAVGVSGAPGGEKDEVCAKAGIAAVTERLEFAD